MIAIRLIRAATENEVRSGHKPSDVLVWRAIISRDVIAMKPRICGAPP
jgi:hypothetical protein